MLNPSTGLGRVVLITGAGSKRGFGRTSAVLLARHGARVVVTDLPSQAATGREVVEEIRRDGGEAEWFPLDVTSEGGWKDAVAFAERTYGPLDVLVNNAGYAQEHGIYKHPTSDWRKQLAINQDGVYFGIREGSASMVRNAAAEGKSIVNVSSAAALQGAGSGFGYNAAKWAVRGMTKHAAAYLAHRNIRCNSIHPGFFPTDIHDYILANPSLPRSSVDKFLGRAAEGSPMGRWGEPEEIAQAVLFLASVESSYMWGAAADPCGCREC
ncbi:dehydrogenase with different specificity [Hyaloraphidium curvatum]|nr:dehydrogenase with different specificity [Hyaloraphidium curvatum]